MYAAHTYPQIPTWTRLVVCMQCVVFNIFISVNMVIPLQQIQSGELVSVICVHVTLIPGNHEQNLATSNIYNFINSTQS